MVVFDFYDNAVEYLLDRALRAEEVASRIENLHQREFSGPMRMAWRYFSSAQKAEELISQDRWEELQKFLRDSHHIFIRN